MDNSLNGLTDADLHKMCDEGLINQWYVSCESETDGMWHMRVYPGKDEEFAAFIRARGGDPSKCVITHGEAMQAHYDMITTHEIVEQACEVTRNPNYPRDLSFSARVKRLFNLLACRCTRGK
jgi:hypothetical protein